MSVLRNALCVLTVFFAQSSAKAKRLPALFALMLLVAACSTTKRAESPEVITGSEDYVSIRAGVWANPGTLATYHCSTYGKEAVLTSQLVLETGITGATRSYVYNFACQ